MEGGFGYVVFRDTLFLMPKLIVGCMNIMLQVLASMNIKIIGVCVIQESGSNCCT